MAKYRIGVLWQMMAFPVVEADSLAEAVEKLKASPLPEGGEYLDESFGIDRESLGDYDEKEVAAIPEDSFK